MPTGPAALARTAGVPLVRVSSSARGACATACAVWPPIEVPQTAALAAALDRFAAELESAIRERPYQWFCFRKLW